MGKAQNFLNYALTYEGESCLLWPFAKISNGYGQIGLAGTTRFVHRLVCANTHGVPNKKGLQAAHSCGNRSCVNPKHIRWATAHENNGADKVKQGRLAKGEKHGMSKLSQSQVDKIRSSSESAKELANLFEVTPSLINKIRQGLIWRQET